MIGWAYIEKQTGIKRETYKALSSSIDSKYWSWTKPKPNGGTRVFDCPKSQLKYIQRRLAAFFNRIVPSSSAAHGYVPGKSPVTHAKTHQGHKFSFQIDISNFFPSVSTEVVSQALVRNGISESASKVLAIFVTYKNHLPQGAPTSPIVSNLVMSALDAEMLHICHKHGIRYTRYSDDLSFSSKSDFTKVAHLLVYVVKRHGFKINTRKTHYKVGPRVITGVNVSNNGKKAASHIYEKYEAAPDGASKAGLENYIRYVRNA